MKSRVLATLLLAGVGVLGLMGGTSSAKVVIKRTGALDVSRTTTLIVVPLSPDTAQYSGFVSLAPAQIRVMAQRVVKKPDAVRKSAATSGKKKAKKKNVRVPSQAQQAEAKRQAEELCNGFTRLTFLEVFHLSNPPFLLGRVLPQLSYAFTSNRPPPGDPVRAQQVGTDFGGTPVVTTGPFKWTVSCSPIERTVSAP